MLALIRRNDGATWRVDKVRRWRCRLSAWRSIAGVPLRDRRESGCHGAAEIPANRGRDFLTGGAGVKVR
jgi:hypothetical protein